MRGARSRAAVLALGGVLLAAAPTEGQEPDEACPEHVVIPGGSDREDRTLHRCNLEGTPGPVSSLDGLPAPMFARSAHADLLVVVGSDGRVDRDLTRYFTVSLDSVFHRRFLEAFRELRHEPARTEEGPVRYGYRLAVRTELRRDTVPEELVWRRVPGELRDSLVGTWQPVDPPPPLTEEQTARAVHDATLVLREMQVLLPDQPVPYCVLPEGPRADAVRDAVLRALRPEDPWAHHFPLAGAGCDRDVDVYRYLVGAPLRTGGGRTVVEASGDFLRSWPPGFDGRWHRAWRAYCVVPEDRDAWGSPACDVLPVFSRDPVVGGWGPSLVEPAEGPHDPVELALRVTTAGAFHVDTLKGVLPGIPALAGSAVLDPGLERCSRSASIVAWAEGAPAGGNVLWLSLPHPGRGGTYGDVAVVGVRGARPDGGGTLRCTQGVRVARPFALFTVGGLGDPVDAPVHVCIDGLDCRRAFTVEPERHELAAEPHLRFRLSDLRPETLRGRIVQLRLTLDRPVPDAVPFVILDVDGDLHGALLQARDDDEREYGLSLGRTPPYPPRTEVRVYLVRVGKPGRR